MWLAGASDVKADDLSATCMVSPARKFRVNLTTYAHHVAPSHLHVQGQEWLLLA